MRAAGFGAAGGSGRGAVEGSGAFGAGGAGAGAAAFGAGFAAGGFAATPGGGAPSRVFRSSSPPNRTSPPGVNSYFDFQIDAISWICSSPLSRSPACGTPRFIAEASFGESTPISSLTRNSRAAAKRTRSPLASGTVVIRTPFTNVPFAEPRSETVRYAFVLSKRACVFETAALSMTRLHALARPTVNVPFGISRTLPASGPSSARR